VVIRKIFANCNGYADWKLEMEEEMKREIQVKK